MPEGRVRIITDSACDLDIDITDSMGVTVVPLTVEIDGVSYRDRIDITPREMFRRMSEDGALPRSAQVPPISFIEVFKECVDNGDIPVYAGFSSKLSGTYNSGKLRLLSSTVPSQSTPRVQVSGRD
jgi:DegV family protein with EDD domain